MQQCRDKAESPATRNPGAFSFETHHKSLIKLCSGMGDQTHGLSIGAPSEEGVRTVKYTPTAISGLEELRNCTDCVPSRPPIFPVFCAFS